MHTTKNKNIFLMITLILFSFFVIVATYAYFVAQGGATSNSAVRVQTSTTDNLSFSVGSSIALTADQTSFASGKGNVTGSTTATAVLTANNATNKATEHYYLYLNVTANTFIYSTSNKTAELLLSIADPNGKSVTSIDGLNYTTSGGVSGFDITNFTGTIKLVDAYEIVATPNKTDKWQITVTFVNLNSDQNVNSGKQFTGNISIGKEGIKLATYITNLYTGNQGENRIYYHNSSLSGGAKDNSYRYAGGNPNNYVCFGSSEAVCPTENLYRIIGVIDGKIKLIKATWATSDLLGTDGDYANGYVFYWNYKSDTTVNNGKGTNDWTVSLLNKTNLNTNFLNNIGTAWSEKIADTTWLIGGNKYGLLFNSNAADVYQSEIVNPSVKKEYTSKVALMYISDYMYAASSDYWGFIGYNSSDTSGTYAKASAYNWLYLNVYEWLLTPQDDTSNLAAFVRSDGSIRSYNPSDGDVVRPCFFLKDNTTYNYGVGTKDNPYRLT